MRSFHQAKLLGKRFKVRVRNALRTRDNEADASAARHFRVARELITKVDLDGALIHAMKAASSIEDSNNYALMYKIGSALQPLGARDAGLKLIARAEKIRTGLRQDDWNGEDISDRTLLVEWRRGDIGIGIRSAGLIAHAAQRAKRCIVLMEPRLIPLYRRTVEHLDLRSKEDDPAASFAEADIVASFNTLEALFGPGSKDAAPFLPLRADPSLVNEFRTKYQRGLKAPLVGMSWGSSVTKKGVPPLTDWDQLLRSVHATYVSLQYGEIANVVKRT
jgi:hypothetical protein